MSDKPGEPKKGPTPDQIKALMRSDKNWALVELHRWCYGELPKPTDMRKIDIAKALTNIADGIVDGSYENNQDKIITLHNMCSVLYYLAENYDFQN